jgi:anti-sigma factor RsiW
MNCEKFNEQMLEYLDETLPAAEQSAARDHIQTCHECQRSLARQQAFAKSIQGSFVMDTQGLALRPETKRNILSSVRRGNIFEIFWVRAALAGAAVACLAAFLITGARYHSMAKTNHDTLVVDVPTQTQTHIYRRQKNMVIDDVVTETTDIEAVLPL